MFEVSDRAADWMVERLVVRAQSLRRQAYKLRGHQHAEDRARMRDMAHECDCIVAGLNTGEGVTRASARRTV